MIRSTAAGWASVATRCSARSTIPLRDRGARVRHLRRGGALRRRAARALELAGGGPGAQRRSARADRRRGRGPPVLSRCAYSPASPAPSKWPRGRAGASARAWCRSTSRRGSTAHERVAERPLRVVARSRAGGAERGADERAGGVLDALDRHGALQRHAGRGRALVDLRADVAGVDGGDRDAVALLEPQRVASRRRRRAW